MISISLTRRILPKLILAVGLLGFSPLHGQSVSGTILGTVQDETGAAIPNATISVKNLEPTKELQKPKDIWDKAAVISSFLSNVVIAVVGLIVTASIQRT